MSLAGPSQGTPCLDACVSIAPHKPFSGHSPSACLHSQGSRLKGRRTFRRSSVHDDVFQGACHSGRGREGSAMHVLPRSLFPTIHIFGLVSIRVHFVYAESSTRFVTTGSKSLHEPAYASCFLLKDAFSSKIGEWRLSYFIFRVSQCLHQ